MNLPPLGGGYGSPASQLWPGALVQTFLATAFSQDERHLRRLGKVPSLEAGSN
jgi:hypothetical protein